MRLVGAILASTVVAALMIAVTERVRRQSTTALLGSAMVGSAPPDFLEFLEQTTPRCGAWPTAAALEPLKALRGETAASPLVMRCANPNKLATRSIASGDPSECSDWCEQSRAKNPKMLCCELTSAKTGATCTASDGFAALLPNVTAAATNAYAACPTLGGSDGGATRYDCEHTNNMKDAMHITLKPPEPEKCAQICLPHGLFNIAQHHGVQQGYCSDSGFVEFRYSSSHAGVKVRRAPAQRPAPCLRARARAHASARPVCARAHAALAAHSSTSSTSRGRPRSRRHRARETLARLANVSSAHGVRRGSVLMDRQPIGPRPAPCAPTVYIFFSAR